MFLRRFLLGALIALNLFLGHRALFSDQGVAAYGELTTKHAELERRVERLTEENRELSRQIRLLTRDRDYIEAIIRKEMRFVKPDEVVYVFPDSGTESGSESGPGRTALQEKGQAHEQ